MQVAQCAQQFTFGYKGKPFYRCEPRKTEAKALAIVRHLEKRCGPSNYDYEVLLGEAQDITRAPDLSRSCSGDASRLPLTLLHR